MVLVVAELDWLLPPPDRVLTSSIPITGAGATARLTSAEKGKGKMPNLPRSTSQNGPGGGGAANPERASECVCSVGRPVPPSRRSH